MKRFARVSFPPIWSFFFVAACCWLAGAGSVYATSVSITVSGNEGGVPVNASASFTGYQRCDNSTPPNCWIDNSGSVAVYQDNGYLGGKSGNVSADFSITVDAGAMSQGSHTFKAVATDSNGVTSASTQAITIDNTPELTVTVGQPDGDMQVGGTVDFKGHLGGAEGTIFLYHVFPNGYANYHGSKTYEGAAPINWTWEDVVGSPADAGSWSQGANKVRAIARAANGAEKVIDVAVTIDNTPKISILGPRYFPDNTFDILGTVVFKERVGGTEGTVAIYLKEVGQTSYTYYGSKNYEGRAFLWKFFDFTGVRLSKASWGAKELMVQIVATAANGGTATVQQYLMIPALGCPVPIR